MDTPSPLLALLFGVICHLAMLSLGRVAGREAGLVERLGVGWGLSMALAYIVLCLGPDSSGVLMVLAWTLALGWLWRAWASFRTGTWKGPWKGGEGLPFGVWLLLAGASALFLIRMVASLQPINNWDSLNHHLPLLLSRLMEGGWDPMVWVATERRTPLFSILPKLWAISLDPSGRALVVQGLLLGLSLLLGMGEVMRTRMDRTTWFLPILMVWSLSDVWRHLLSAGDEIWMVLGAMVFLFVVLKREPSWKRVLLGGASLFMCLGIKATAIFFVPPYALAFLMRRRHLNVGLLGMGLGLFLAFLAMAPNLLSYSMAYPANRWSDLLAKSSPQVFQGKEIKEQRLTLGLIDHRDNRSPGTKVLRSWKENLSRVPYLGLGPYLLWLLGGLVLGGWSILKQHFQEWWLLGASLLAVGLTMLVWNFSPQAFFRYLLPVWWVLLLSSGILLADLKRGHARWLTCGVGVMLMFALALEGREVLKTARRPNIWEPFEFWLQEHPEGALISAWREEKASLDRAFYIGSMSVLMVDQQRHWLAQLGNEVGWRRPDEIKAFLKRENIRWWLLSSKADALDPLYRRLTTLMVDSGVLENVKVLNSGEIYRVRSLSD